MQKQLLIPSAITSAKPRMNAALAVAAASLLLWVPGCSQIPTYNRNTLPKELGLTRVIDPRTVDLAPFAGPPVNPELIQCGDELAVSIAAGLEVDDKDEFSVRVGDDGVAPLPEIGPVRLVGAHPLEAEQQIARACVYREVYRRPTVILGIKKRQKNRIRVLGAVQQPSSSQWREGKNFYEIPRSVSYLKTAIDASGGLTKDAGTKVWIFRPVVPPGESNWICVDLVDPAARSRGSPYLGDGSVVTAEERPPRPIEVAGLVRKPGLYDYPIVHGLTLSGAVGMAGGENTRVADTVVVTRTGPDGRALANIRLNLRSNADRNFPLAPGDVVRVKQTPITWAQWILESVVRISVGSNMPLW